MNKKIISLILGLMCVVLSYGIAVQIKTIKGTESTISTNAKENELRDAVLKAKEKYDNLYSELEEAENILETLLKKHQIVLIDTDFSTNIDYFTYSQQVYLVQTMDVLTIQPLTEFLSKLKSQNAINSDKIRIILNKYMSLDGITVKQLIGGLAFYNDPSMSYMQQLFEKNGVRYTTISYDQNAYEVYLQDVARYQVSIDYHSNEFRMQLERLADDVIRG